MNSTSLTESASSSVRKHRVRVRFYQELGDFLAPHRRGREFELTVNDGTTTKALVEHCGVPHGEVDLLLVDGESVDFAHKLRGGQRVSVYPVFESFDISALTRVRPAPLRAVRFLVDANLAKLASLLRMCGLDATDASMLRRTACGAAAREPVGQAAVRAVEASAGGADVLDRARCTDRENNRADAPARPGESGDAERDGRGDQADQHAGAEHEDACLVAAARREQRIILTRDRRLLERKAVTHGCFVRSQDPEQQLLFVLRRFDLAAAVRPFSRCMRCNEPLEPVAKADVLHRLPPMVRVEQHTFSRCPRCARLYWPGSHWQRMRRRLDTLLATAHRPADLIGVSLVHPARADRTGRSLDGSTDPR